MPRSRLIIGVVVAVAVLAVAALSQIGRAHV